MSSSCLKSAANVEKYFGKLKEDKSGANNCPEKKTKHDLIFFRLSGQESINLSDRTPKPELVR
jgi:hypothetical protein